jgi:hypothetical protein
MLVKKEFHFSRFDDRQELLARRKFGVDWVEPQAEHEGLLRFFYSYPPSQGVPFELLAFPEADLVLSSAPGEFYKYRGPTELLDKALVAFDYAVTRGQQLIWARKALRLFDKYGGRPTNGSEDFERLDPGDDRDMLREARRLAAGSPNAAAAIGGVAAERVAPPIVGANVLPIKPRWRPSGPVGLAVAVALKKCDLEDRRPYTMTLKQIAKRIAPAVGKAVGRSSASISEEAALEKAISRYYADVESNGTPPDISDINDMSAMSRVSTARS